MKRIAFVMAGLGFLWIGFWLGICDKEMLSQFQRALDDGFSKYPPKP